MIKLIKEVKLWNNGYVKQYDFSKANSSEESRIEHVCAVARVCRGDKTPVKTDEELYQQLLTEHDGKPGSVFEFVPVELTNSYGKQTERFGTQERVEVYMVGDYTFTYTNLRACIADNLNKYNNDVKSFFVFKVKVPQMIVKHILRHRMLSFQEMSERTNKLREYYFCDEFEPIMTSWEKDVINCIDSIKEELVTYKWNDVIYRATQQDFDTWQTRYKIRQELLNKGSHGLAYTTLWIAGWRQDKSGWDNFFAVRTKKPAQREVIELANVIKQMMEE